MLKQAQKACGCGAGCQCGCNSAVCESSCDSGLSRPNFFAGQLLTDDDLRATLNYVIEKNRLHNRHFMGDGVVCGLEVQHHPCPESRRKVVVKPGHALDCCGNDIVVPCEEELDIVNMARELRAKLRGGYDCGDPCREKPALFPVAFGPEDELDAGRISKELRKVFKDNDRPLPDDPKDVRVVVLDAGRLWQIGAATQYRIRKDANTLNVYRAGDDEKSVYNLYVRYHEMGFDPVTPFQVDGDCNSACQASRIRESYRFELSCDEPAPEIDLRSRLKQCNEAVAGYEKMQAEALHGARGLETVEQVLIQFDQIRQALAIPTDGSDNPLITELHNAIDETTLPTVSPNPTVEDQVNAAIAVHRLLTLSLRAFYTPIKEKVTTTLRNKIKNVFLPAITVILKELRTVNGKTATVEFPFPVELPVINLLQDRADDLETALTNGVDGLEFDQRAQIVGELITLKIANDIIRRLDKIDEELKRLVRAGTVVVDRELRHFMNSVNLRLFFDMSEHTKTPELLKVVKDQVAIVTRAVAEISRKCLCEIVLPPCPPCDDTRVLVAALTVENCDVVDICNVKRKFVMTGPSLNYWFSNFGILDDIRASCCPTPMDIAQAKLDEIERLRQQTEQWASSVLPDRKDDRPYTPNLVDIVNNPDQWERLGAFQNTAPDELEWSAIEPAGFRLSRELQPREVASPQFINVALSQLASRPAADIRGILDRSGDAKSPSQLERELRDEIDALEGELEIKIGTAVNTSSQANSAATAADTKAKEAKDAAEAAGTKAQQGIDDAAAAATKAQQGIDDAAAADTKAQQGIDDAAAADTKAQQGIDDAAAADTKAEEAKADARFDFDNDGTRDKTLQEIVTELRASDISNLAKIKQAVDAIIGTP